jgi:hypothetical protein
MMAKKVESKKMKSPSNVKSKYNYSKENSCIESTGSVQFFQNFVKSQLKKNKIDEWTIDELKSNLSIIFDEYHNKIPSIEHYGTYFDFKNLSSKEKQEIQKLIMSDHDLMKTVLESFNDIYSFLSKSLKTDSDEMQKLLRDIYKYFHSTFDFFLKIIRKAMTTFTVDYSDKQLNIPDTIKIPNTYVPYLISCFGYNISFYEKYIQLFRIEDSGIKLLLEVEKFIKTYPEKIDGQIDIKKFKKHLKKLLKERSTNSLNTKHSTKTNQRLDMIYTCQRRVIAICAMLDELGFNLTVQDRKEIVPMIEFLTGNNKDNIYKNIKNYYNENLNRKDIEYVIEKFQEINQNKIVSNLKEKSNNI